MQRREIELPSFGFNGDGSQSGRAERREELRNVRDELTDVLTEDRESMNSDEQAHLFRNLAGVYHELADAAEDHEVSDFHRTRTAECLQAAAQCIEDDGLLSFSSSNGRRTADSVSGMGTEVDFESMMSTPDHGFEKIGGYSEIKQYFRETFIRKVANPEVCRLYPTEVPCGVILYGPSGTGKSTFAEAAAYELSTYDEVDEDVTVMEVDSHNVKHSKIGETAKRLHRIFTQARQIEPAVLIFDEMDAIAPARNSGIQKTSETVDMTNRLLSEITDIDDDELVICFGTTNLLSDIDYALYEEGHRFETVEVGLPDTSARQEILEIYLDSGDRDPALETIDVDSWVERTDGFTGAKIKKLVEKAGDLAVDEYLNGARSVRLSDGHLDSAFEDEEMFQE